MAMLRIQWVVVAQQLWAQERVLNNFTANQFKRVGINTLSLGLQYVQFGEDILLLLFVHQCPHAYTFFFRVAHDGF